MDSQIQKVSKWLGSGSINIFGMPFAGKDTQGRRLADIFKAELVAGGDILRSYADQETLRKFMSTGELIPTDLYMDIVLPFLSQKEFEGRPLILSSVGRWHGEERMIESAANSSNHPIKAALLLRISENDVWDHFNKAKYLNDRGKRDDDDSHVLQTRIQEFQTKTMPVIEFYRMKGLLLEINGTLPREEVTKEIITRLANLTIVN